MKITGRKIAYLGMMTAFALTASYIEWIIPTPQLVPGMKLGLANAVVMMILYQYGIKETILVNGMRIILSGFMFGNMAGIMYSLAGAVASMGVMVLLKKSTRFSYIGVSVAGGISHNIGQIFVAALIIKTTKILYYIPFLIITGVLAGILIGLLVGQLMQYTKKIRKEQGDI